MNPEVRNFQELERFIRERPRDADQAAGNWRDFLKSEGRENPDVFLVDSAQDWYSWLSRHPERSVDPDLFVGKEIQDSYFYLRDQEDDRQMQSQGFIDQTHLPSELLALPLLAAAFRDRTKFMEEDPQYKKIIEQKKLDWLSKNAKTDFNSQQGLDYIYGSLDGENAPSLAKDAEAEFRANKKFAGRVKRYDKEKKKVYKDIASDRAFTHVERLAQEEFNARFQLAKLQGNADVKIAGQIWQRRLEQFARKYPEKAKAYAAKHEGIKQAYEKVKVQEQLENYKAVTAREIKYVEKTQREPTRKSVEEATKRLGQVAREAPAAPMPALEIPTPRTGIRPTVPSVPTPSIPPARMPSPAMLRTVPLRLAGLAGRAAVGAVAPLIANPVTLTVLLLFILGLFLILFGTGFTGAPGAPGTPTTPIIGGTLDYKINFRDATVIPPTRTSAEGAILREFPKAQLQYWDVIVSQSINNGWNPAFVLALWIEETGASHHTKTSVGGGGVPSGTKPDGTPIFANGHLGCAPGEDQTIDESLRCLFRNFNSYANDQFEPFMRRYSGEAATGPFVNNRDFPSRMRRYYSFLVPGGIISTPPSVVATCPVLNITKINCGSLFSPKAYNQVRCAIGPEPEYGHCSIPYGTCADRERNRRSKAIDLASPLNTAVYLPTINNEHFIWVYAGLGNSGNVLPDSDGGGYIRGFKPADERQHKWYIYFMHVQKDAPPLSVGQEISSGQVGALIADTGFDHVHVNVGWEINNFRGNDSYDPGWKRPDVDLNMCTK